jgi:hypothetical protein
VGTKSVPTLQGYKANLPKNGDIEMDVIRHQKFHFRDAALGASRSNTQVLRGQATTRGAR